MSVRRLNEPQPAQVRCDEHGLPVEVHWQARTGIAPLGARGRHRAGPAAARARQRSGRVEYVLETWRVDDRWWTDAPVRRIYHECQLASGHRVIVAWDLVARRWLIQR